MYEIDISKSIVDERVDKKSAPRTTQRQKKDFDISKYSRKA